MAAWTSQRSGNWSDSAANGTSPWNGGGNPASGVPASGDTVTVAAGHTVTFDVNQSGFASGLAGLVINGTLQASTAAGTYYLKMAANITASSPGGQLNAGSAGTAYPANCTFTIYLNGNYSIDGGASNYLMLNLYCSEPTNPIIQLVSATARPITSVTTGATTTIGCTGHGYSVGNRIYLANVGGIARLSNRFYEVATAATDSFTIRFEDSDSAVDSTGWGTYTSGGLVCPATAEAIGQTQLEVDTDVTMDGPWALANALVRINDVDRGVESEERTLVGLAAGYVTVTAGLTAAKLSGAQVMLASRNITITCSGTTVSNGLVCRGAGSYLRCAIRPGNTATNGVNAGTGHTIGGVISGANYGVSSGVGHTIAGVIGGCSSGVYSGNGHTITGVIGGCANGVNTGTGHTIGGVISGATYGVNAGTGHTIAGVIRMSFYAFLAPNGHTITGAIVGCAYGISGGSGQLLNASIEATNASGFFNLCMFNAIGADNFAATPVGSFVNNSNGLSVDGRAQIVMRHFAGVDGSLLAWMYAGTVTDRSGAEPTLAGGYTYKFSPVVATHPTYVDWPFWLPAGETIAIRVWLQKTGTGWIQTPRFQIFHAANDPFGGGIVDYEQIMVDDTNEQAFLVTFTAAEYGLHVLRVRCQNATDNLYAAVSIGATDYPAPGDVRRAISYGHGDYVGSAYIPAAASVLYGVPVDATTGTAIFAPEDIADTVTSSVVTALLGITSTAVTISAPVAADNATVTLVRGDDYLAANDRALFFTSLSWPTLTGGTVICKMRVAGGVTEYPMTVTGAQAIRLELTSAQTAALFASVYDFDIEAIIGGYITTLAQGYLYVTPDVR
jgi:hypothetical protein